MSRWTRDRFHRLEIIVLAEIRETDTCQPIEIILLISDDGSALTPAKEFLTVFYVSRRIKNTCQTVSFVRAKATCPLPVRLTVD